MPPTMMLTFGVAAESSSELPELLRPQAAMDAARVRATALAAIRPVVVRNIGFSCSWAGLPAGGGESSGGVSDAGGLAVRRRPPRGESLLQPGDQPLGDEREHGDDDHSCVDPGG